MRYSPRACQLPMQTALNHSGPEAAGYLLQPRTPWFPAPIGEQPSSMMLQGTAQQRLRVIILDACDYHIGHFPKTDLYRVLSLGEQLALRADQVTKGGSLMAVT